jgi:transcriptional regulator with XRE-family HTH domain
MSDDLVVSPSAFLLGELRRARSSAGLSQEDLGKTINYSGSQVSAVENGQRPPTRDYLVAIDGALHTGGLFERMQSNLANFDQAPIWFRDWLVIEREATLIRWFEPLIVPGLLQTRAYAQALIVGSGMVDSSEVDQLVSARMDRRALIESPRPPTLIAILDEGVLRRPIGSSELMAEQCSHLVEAAQLSHVQIHIVPASTGVFAGLGGPFTLARGRDFETAHLDNVLRPQVADGTEAIDSLTRRWEAIRSEALPRVLSLELMREAANTWQT